MANGMAEGHDRSEIEDARRQKPLAELGSHGAARSILWFDRDQLPGPDLERDDRGRYYSEKGPSPHWDLRLALVLALCDHALGNLPAAPPLGRMHGAGSRSAGIP